MKTIQYIFNLFYYHIFLTAKAFNNSFNSLFLPLYRLKIMRRRCQKYGIEDSYEWAKKRFESENYPEQGIVIRESERLLYTWTITMLFAIGLIIIKIIKCFNSSFFDIILASKLGFIGCFLMIMAITFFSTWIFSGRNHKYLIYFRFFENLDHRTKRKNRLLAWLIFLLSLGLAVFSFWLVSK